MKFNEIKPFIICNNYSVDVSLRSLPSQIEEYQEDLGLELNPDFQRGYVWNQQQKERYMEYLLRDGQSGRDIYLNHTNWNRTKGIGDGWFVCVDGLQRLTTCLEFMDNQVKAFGKYKREFEDKLPYGMGRLRIHVNNLSTRAEVLQWYLEMNAGGTVHSEEELERVARLLREEQTKGVATE